MTAKSNETLEEIQSVELALIFNFTANGVKLMEKNVEWEDFGFD